MTLPVTLAVKVDWNNDGDFGDSNEDISAYVQRLSVRRGRASVNDEFGAGSCTFYLDNQTGLFSPFNSGGALYGSLLPGRAVNIEATHDSITYPVFYGYLSDFRQERSPQGAPLMTFSAFDAFDVLRLGRIRLALQESKRVDELLDAVLDEAGWSAALRDLDTANVTVDRFWVQWQSPFDALRQAAKQELGGQLFMGRDGRVTFRERFARSSTSLYTTLTGPQALALEIRRDQLYDEVHHTRAGLDVDTATTVLYTHTPAGRILMPGTTSPLNTIHGDYLVAGKNVFTPVSTTDYLANSAADGSGTDKTAQVAVDDFTSYGGGYSITFGNLDSSPVYLYLNSGAAFQVRGQAVRLAADERLIKVQSTSPIVTGQVLTDAFDFNDDADSIEGYARYRAAVFSSLQPRPTVRLTPRNDSEMATVLGGEIGARVQVQNLTGQYPTQMDETFFIESIGISFAPGGFVDASWGLFQKDLAGGSFFRISGPAGGGQDYSTIAPAAATAGYDRIAW